MLKRKSSDRSGVTEGEAAEERGLNPAIKPLVRDAVVGDVSVAVAVGARV